MKVTYKQNISTFESWELEDPARLVVSAIPGAVVLDHFSSGYGEQEAVQLSLSPSEAISVAERIEQALKGNKPINVEGSKDNPQLAVEHTNEGEPFREGVLLSLLAGDWNNDFHFAMEWRTAQSLSKALFACANCQ